MLPNLADNDYKILNDLIMKQPIEFRTDMTGFYINEMFNYIDSGRIWRSSVMGETRGGKSEFVSSLCFLYKKRFNKNVIKGTYLKNSTVKEIFDNESITLKEISFNTDYVYGSNFEYSDKQRKRAMSGNIVFGQVHQIDEDRKVSGGLGSMTGQIENQNINNISAKFMQSEFYITPDYMITRNAPYGIRIYKKDEIRRINYGLLYKIEMNNRGGADFKFMGWVGIPLHPFNEFRREYNKLKDLWIVKEIKGGADDRSKTRMQVAEKLAESKIFQYKENGKGFLFPKSERMAYLEQLIIKGEISNYNEIEKIRIVEQATLIKKLGESIEE